MKIIIPFSGGVNSTYSLYRWLSETDADVLAYHSIDRWESEEANVEEFKRLEKVKV
jgi:tRNA U34 2-thiouridine synthase MnmA/TrmU